MNKDIPKLPEKPDVNILELLIKAKMFLEHALSHSSGDSAIDGMIAIHSFDNSIEYLLRIIIKHLKIETIINKNLDTVELSSLAGEINKFLSSNYKFRLPYFSEIKLIRKSRNLVQHGMVDPRPELRRYSTISENFFEVILKKIFGLKKENLKISTLIQNNKVRSHLKKAEEYLSKKEYLKSIVSSRDAFENTSFFQLGNSHLKLSSIPGLIEIKKSFRNLFWFLTSLSDEVLINRLNIDFTKYDRFKDYIEHIPNEFNAEKKSYTLMQRSWKKEDAIFCYNFVSYNLIRLQSKELEPLYKIKSTDTYTFEDEIGDVNLRNKTEEGCFYFLEKEDEEIELIYVGKLLKDKIKKLEANKEYNILKKCYKNNVLENIMEYRIKLLDFNISLITNSPPRWEVIFWFKKIPFTWIKKEYENGSLVKESVNLNESNMENIIKINDAVINRKLAKKIINLRKEIKKISKIEELKKIEGITDEQIYWLSYFTKV